VEHSSLRAGANEYFSIFEMRFECDLRARNLTRATHQSEQALPSEHTQSARVCLNQRLNPRFKKAPSKRSKQEERVGS
jgi:hypothetical protein